MLPLEFSPIDVQVLKVLDVEPRILVDVVDVCPLFLLLLDMDELLQSVSKTWPSAKPPHKRRKGPKYSARNKFQSDRHKLQYWDRKWD